MTEVLQVTDLAVHFPARRGPPIRAVDGVSFSIAPGETLGLVGESGCGKSTVSNAIVGLQPPTRGSIRMLGTELAGADRRTLRAMRAQVQMVFQDPATSLNPRMTVGAAVGEPLVVRGIARGRALRDRVAALLEEVGLRPEFMHRFPHAFSGGQRQRIGIARALATGPRLVVADEPVSALDVSVQAQVLNLLLELQSRLRLTFLFVAHDLSVVRHISDRVAVMYVGQLVELAPTAAIFRRPRHPYTAALMRAVPIPDPRVSNDGGILRGEVPSPASPPSGCYFHPRCVFAEEQCKREAPALQEVSPGHFARCHFAKELELGVG